MTRRRWTLRFAACLGVLTVLISGCTEKQQANETLPSASKTSASESQEKLPPLGPEDFPMPKEARTKDAAGAKAFVHYFLALYNWTRANLNTADLRSLSSGCELCKRLIDQVEETAAVGQSYRGGEVRVEAISEPGVEGNQSRAAFSISEAALIVVDAQGHPVDGRTYPATTSPSCGAILSWDASRSTWVMTQLDVA